MCMQIFKYANRLLTCNQNQTAERVLHAWHVNKLTFRWKEEEKNLSEEDKRIWKESFLKYTV